MEGDNPMQALFEMYDAQVAEHDKAGYAQKFKDCTDLFFKDVGEHWHFEKAPIHFTDVEYLDGYFLFGMGTNSVIHFHVAECPGWKFAIWWETPEDKDDDDIITGQFFTQYEETIDKFKPSRSDMCIKIVMRLDVDEPYCEDYVDAANIINFIKNEPALAFCRDYWGWDYNAEYHTREEAQIEYSIGKTSPYTPVFVEPMMRFAYVVMHGKRVKYRIINVSRKPTVAHCPLEGAIQVYKQNLAQISEYRQRNHSILEDCREARYG